MPPTPSPDFETIGIIGLGYVGLPLALGFVAQGRKIIGLDVDPGKVEAINAGRSYIAHIPAEKIAAGRDRGLLEASADFARAEECDALIVCVPTPLDRYHQPDLSYVSSTLESLLPHLREGQVLSLESTTFPGTTEEVLRPPLEERGLIIGENFHLVYSPEREDPGNPDFNSTNIPKVVGGSTPACLEAGLTLYNIVCEQTVPVSSPAVAEFTKLLENIYRSVNIGLVNELKLVADRMGVDIWEVIAAASTKPFGYKAFYPGPGLGGHCIPIDPFYLTWKAREFGIHTRFIELAGEINASMPEHVVRRASEFLNDRGKAVSQSRILIMGLAYKEDVDDLRESPSFHLLDLLEDRGAELAFFDPHIPEVPPTREHANRTGMKSVDWNAEVIGAFDLVIIATNHKAHNYAELLDWQDSVLDTRNAIVKAGLESKSGQVRKA